MTLSEATIFFKKAFKYGLIGLAAVALLWISVGYAITLFNQVNPPKETPTVSFGAIPKPILPETPTTSLNFVLDTLDGRLPTLPKVLPVYQFAAFSPNLLDADRAKVLADKFGFKSDPQILDTQTYQFTDPKIPQTLKINIVTKNFTLTPNLADSSIPKNPPEDSIDSLISLARSNLKGYSLLPLDLEKSDAKVTYKKLSGSVLSDARSLSEANFARVDIMRDGVAGYPIVGPRKDQSLVNLLFSGPRAVLVGLNYTYWPYFIDGSSTYPLLSVEAAWQAIQSGQGVLISPEVTNFRDVRVREILIAYFETEPSQSYLQPIFLFDGVSVPQTGTETPVRVYLPAVDPAYFSK